GSAPRYVHDPLPIVIPRQPTWPWPPPTSTPQPPTPASRASDRPPPRPLARARDAAIGAAIALLVAIVYAPVAHHEFVSLDDALYFTSNPNLDGHLGTDDLIGAFRFYAANWSPLTAISIPIHNPLYAADPPAPLLPHPTL